MLFNLNEIMSSPLEWLKSLLIMLPGIMLALSVHESAHGWVAERCGDDTARLMGRITLNPLKHIDPLGFAMMFLAGFGWAKPVPVNPLKYKNYRSDDLKVSLAGITANLCLFFICFLILAMIFSFALAKLPEYDNYYTAIRQGEQGNFLTSYDGEKSVILDGYYLPVESMLEYYVFTFFAPEYLITPVLGSVVSVIYRMVAYCMIINIGLAVFNLIPIPPFDGYHVLNDLVLKQDLFAQQRTARIASMVLWGLIILGNYNSDLDIIGKLLNWTRSGLIDSLLAGLRIVLSGMGLA
ncbi:MAG: site-2 protease family protein [Clostridia bacterium]|jgi:Zn-dependent protease|nr:site-2 protease family protein [Clostridia bacterium]